ncbi:MAG: threonine-phosphate decarboxylase, partial [Oscillospiraceae bacterium]
LSLLKKVETCGQAWSVSAVASIAGIEALKCCNFVRESLKKINLEKAFLLSELKNLNIEVIGKEANYIFFYCSDCALYLELQKKGILIRQCQNYNNLDGGYYRISVRTHSENKCLISALKEIMEERGGAWERQ